MIHVAIISHGHEELLISSSLGGLAGAHQEIKVWIKDNKPASNNRLKNYCESNQIFYTDISPGLGFGHNNNFLFDLIRAQHGFSESDIFLVMNPDITVKAETVLKLAQTMKQNDHRMATLNLYRDTDHRTYDTNIRHFPGILSILKMPFVHSFSQTYNKDTIAASGIKTFVVEWASGAFLAFTPEHYQALAGFDASYFMYFEDVDICYRSQKDFRQAIHYYPDLTAVHTAAHKNRNIASQHARWFFHSFFKFLVKRYFRRDRILTPLTK